jgi:CIC family chloride channel protein
MPNTTLKQEPGRRRKIALSFLQKGSRAVRNEISTVYERDLQKWLVIAPIIGAVTGLAITGVAVVILQEMWPPILRYYIAHPWSIVPGVVAGFLIAGLIMQHLTPDANEHSTEEVIRSYHERQGKIALRPFIPKLLAAIATVGFGGSAALEGPSIYGGGAIGSFIWSRLRPVRRLRISNRDRRIMLICGAAAGMSAVFRAPLTGIVFALEMPYKDDLAHEALLPSLIASVVSFMTLSAFLGSKPLFDFAGNESFTSRDLLWCALLGVVIGMVALVFNTVFRRVRTYCVHLAWPHWCKMSLGGLLTGLCGVAFLHLYHGRLVPLGPNYEAIGLILSQVHTSSELVVFGILKLLATIFTLGVGGVSAMFVPLFLTGGTFGTAFAQSVVHSAAPGLYAAVGMACFISAGYKTPLAAAAFVAETTGGHVFIIPALIGSAVAYAVSGDASVSGDQRLHETMRATAQTHQQVCEE